MPVIDDFTRLQHILDAAKKARHYTKGKKRTDLDNDDLLCLAILRLLETIGEATGGVSEDLRSKHPEIPWQQMIGMRNRLIHAYFEVNKDLVWKTVIAELPSLIKQVHRLIQKGPDA
jgi:uncharacterized protein with HEPN domain